VQLDITREITPVRHGGAVVCQYLSDRDLSARNRRGEQADKAKQRRATGWSDGELRAECDRCAAKDEC
jgi:hypothetical protein